MKDVGDDFQGFLQFYTLKLGQRLCDSGGQRCYDPDKTDSLPKEKSSSSDGFTGEFFQIPKEE